MTFASSENESACTCSAPLARLRRAAAAVDRQVRSAVAASGGELERNEHVACGRAAASRPLRASCARCSRRRAVRRRDPASRPSRRSEARNSTRRARPRRDRRLLRADGGSATRSAQNSDLESGVQRPRLFASSSLVSDCSQALRAALRALSRDSTAPGRSVLRCRRRASRSTRAGGRPATARAARRSHRHT